MIAARWVGGKGWLIEDGWFHVHFLYDLHVFLRIYIMNLNDYYMNEKWLVNVWEFVETFTVHVFMWCSMF